MKELMRKFWRRRPRHRRDADDSGDGHEAESTSDSAAKSDQQPMQLPQVQLRFFPTQISSDDREILKAQTFLQKSVEELESVLQAQLDHPGQSSEKLQTRLAACITQGDNARHAEPLKNILTAVEEDRVGRTQASSSWAGAVMQKMYPLTKLALGLTGTLTSSAGYAPVQIVTNSITQVFELALSVPKQSEEVAAGLDSMAADDYLLAELQKMPGDVLDGPILLGAIVLQTRLVEFLRKSILWLKKTFFAKFANCVIEPTQMTDARIELKKAQDALRSHLSVDTYLLMKWQKIATVQADMLSSLCSNEYHTAHLLKQRELHARRLDSSGMWAITDEKFKSWHGDTGGILWCPGLPGAGKTYLASRIVDELQIAGRHRDVGVAYVYCEYGRVQQQSDRLVIEAMARQLIAQKPDLCFKLRQFLENTLATTLDDRKKLLRQVLAEYETTFLVLDALDEFSTEYNDRHRLACTLRDILQECGRGQIRLCITSRQADGIWQVLSAGTVPAKFLDVRSSPSDIRALVEKEYDEASRDSAIKWSCGNDELRQLVIDKVVEKSDCIFKLADLQIRAILQEPSAKVAKSALDHLTKNVNDYYDEAMKRIARQPETKDMVYNLLTWLTFTHSPIHVRELELALSIRPGQSLDPDLEDQRVDVLRYMSLSEGLVSINKSSLSSPYDEGPDKDDEGSESDTSTLNEQKIVISKGAQVTLAHESIRDFLRDIPQPGIPAKGDKFLLHCCLTIMSSPIFVENLQPIWQQLLYRKHLPYRAGKGFSVKFGSSAVEVPVFLFWVLSSWGQHVTDAHLTQEMANAIQKIHKSATATTRDPTRRPWAGPLYWCAYRGWAEACKLLLPLEEELNTFHHLVLDRGRSRSTDETCLFAAVASGDVATVQVFLDDDRIKPDRGKKSRSGCMSPLMQACKRGNRDIVRVLLAKNDIDVNAYDECGHRTELPAILQAKPGISSLLLERDDLDVNILLLSRRPIHHLANIGGSPSELEMLLENSKTDVNGRTDESIGFGGQYVDHRDRTLFCHKRTALMVAAFAGHPAQTSVLLKHPRIDLQLKDSHGMTVLMLACMGWGAGIRQSTTNAELQASVKQHEETFRVLLPFLSSTINDRNARGRTALILASMGGFGLRFNGSESFHEAWERPYYFEYWFQNLATILSLEEDHQVEIVRALLRDDRVDVNIPDEMGHTALDYAMWTRDLTIQERDWGMQCLKKNVESLMEAGPGSKGLYSVPIFDAQDIITKAQSRIDAMSKIHDVLVASGAQPGEAIAPLAIPQDHTPECYLKEVGASEGQKTLENFISALESVV